MQTKGLQRALAGVALVDLDLQVRQDLMTSVTALRLGWRPSRQLENSKVVGDGDENIVARHVVGVWTAGEAGRGAFWCFWCG